MDGAPGARLLPHNQSAAAGRRDRLIELLTDAAQIEHGLMILYLYAAYSLSADNADPTAQRRVQTWRDSILTVAKEEMGHLLTLQNVLCLVGGPISFWRPKFPSDSPLHPFPFVLERLSRVTLSCFVWAEMPDDLDVNEPEKHNPKYKKFIQDHLPTITEDVKSRQGEGHDRNGVEQLYEEIINLLPDPCIPDSEFLAATYTMQASWDDWGRRYRAAPARPGSTTRPKNESKNEVIIRQMGSRTEAVNAMLEVAGQGEAAHLRSRLATEASHFDRFAEVFDKFVANRGEQFVRPVPTNPTTNGTGAGSITAEPSRTWALLFNRRYQMLLTYLTHGFQLAVAQPESPHLRGAIMHKAFGEMYNLKAIAEILVRLPMRPGSKERAGPPFEIPERAALELPPDKRAAYWQSHRANLDAARTLRQQLAAQGLPGGSNDDRYLKTLCSLDEQTTEWVDSIVKGFKTAGG